MAEAWIFVPIVLFLCIAGVIIAIGYFWKEAARTGGGDYKKLADEALRGQRVLLDEMQRMNQTLKEIERLLREV